MTLKGNLEVLNLSDIFQSLSLNQHTGTLRVTDGKREKLVHFAQGEITLLASEKKVRLGEMLVSSGKISPEDLDYALQQQKKSKKKLGEILIEEGFVSEDDIAEIVKQQIEAEIYDLFLWKKAEFEFLIDYIPEKLKNPSHGITKLQFNTSSLIMEALRRLDEWGIISKEIATLKEVYKVVKPNSSAMDEIDLPERVKSEIRLIDGERTVESIADETSLSEFELCKLIFELKTRGIVAPLTPQELSDKADEAFSKGKFRQSSSLYERLVEVLPKNLSIRWHLADSLKSFGDEPLALEQYLFIAGALEGTRDRLELAKAYRAILDLAPDRKDILERLRTLDRAKWQSTALKTLLIVLVLAGVAGGAVYKYGADTVLGPILAKLKEWGSGGAGGSSVRQNEAEAAELFKKHRDALNVQDWSTAHEFGFKIARDYPDSSKRQEVLLPVKITSDPTGHDVFIEGIQKGRTDDYFMISPKKDVTARIKVEIKSGGRTLDTKEIDLSVFQTIPFDLFKHPIFEARSQGAVRGAPVFRNDVVYFASLDGYLHGYALADPSSPSLRHPASLDASQTDMTYGYAVSGLQIVDDVLLYTTIDGDLKGFSLAFRSKAFSFRPLDSNATSQPMFASPVATQAGAALVVAGNSGAIGFVDLKRQAPAGKPIVTSNRITADLVESGNMVFVAGRDNCLYGIDAGERRVAWSRAGKGDYIASPKVVGERFIIAGDAKGELVCLDRRNGAQIWSLDLGDAIIGIDAAADTIVVTTRGTFASGLAGELRAVGLSSGKLIWQAPASKDPGRPLIANDVVFVAGDGACAGIDLATGKERWTAKPRGTKPVNYRGKPALYGGKVYVGAEDGTLYGFDPN